MTSWSRCTALAWATGSIVLVILTGSADAAEFVQPAPDARQPRWGFTDGLQVGIWTPESGDGPRGLLRLCYPVDGEGSAASLVNYIAIEPVVAGKGRGFSELEHSGHDGRPGLRLWAMADALDAAAPDSPPLSAGVVIPESGTPGGRALQVRLALEPFANGAHPYVAATFREQRPDEVEFAVFAEADSAPMAYCTLTATMGNYARLRRLWLNGRVVTSGDLWPDQRGTDFAPDVYFTLEQLTRSDDGDVVVAATPDESEPWRLKPFAPRQHWWWHGGVFTQYWRKPAATVRPDLHVRANGRWTYWRTAQSIPGGIAFENIELRERFHPGQVFCWGITSRTPQDLGLALERG